MRTGGGGRQPAAQQGKEVKSTADVGDIADRHRDDLAMHTARCCTLDAMGGAGGRGDAGSVAMAEPEVSFSVEKYLCDDWDMDELCALAPAYFYASSNHPSSFIQRRRPVNEGLEGTTEQVSRRTRGRHGPSPSFADGVASN